MRFIDSLSLLCVLAPLRGLFFGSVFSMARQGAELAKGISIQDGWKAAPDSYLFALYFSALDFC
jgi:hypothetical protein